MNYALHKKIEDLTIDEVTNYYISFIETYRNKTNISMFDFGDELSMELMKKISPSFNIARKLEISQLPIFNNGWEADRTDNLNKLQQWFRPAVWCYDFYPVEQEWIIKRTTDKDGKHTYQKVGPSGIKPPYVNANMFLLLERYRDMADKTGRPFWYYVQCMSYCDLRNKVWSDSTAQCTVKPVSEGYMRFSAFSALAYGAKGMRYWAYSLRASQKDEAYFEAPIDLGNNTTNVYYWVQMVNREVQAFGHIFLHSVVSDVYHVWNDVDFKYAHMAGVKTLPASGAGPISRMSCDGDGVTVSLFTSEGKHYVMLVSHDINRGQAVDIWWRPGHEPSIVSGQPGVPSQFILLQSRTEIMENSPLKQSVDKINLNRCGYYIATYEPNMEYENPTGDEFPILASTPCQEWVKTLTESMFSRLNECGFNMVDVNSNIWDVQSASTLAAAKGIRLAVSGFNWRDTDSCKRKIDNFDKTGNIAAWNIYSDIASDPMVNNMVVFARTYNAVRSIDPGRLLLWNMIPSTAASDSVKKFTQMQTLLKPGMWCAYETASCSQKCDSSGNSSDDDKPEVLASFYSNLETFSAIARDTDRPFWHYANCMSYHKAGNTFRIPVSEVIMRHSVFTALAYGAKGLRWWQYAVRKQADGVTYSDAPIGEDGGKTPTWGMAKRINSEVRAYGQLFLNAHAMEVYHTGNTIPAGTRRLPTGHGPLMNLFSGTAGVTVSFFSSGGKEHLMVVNHDVSYAQSITIFWKPGIYPSEAANEHPEAYKSYTLEASVLNVAAGHLLKQQMDKVSLLKGGYFIMSWTPNKEYVNPTGTDFPICSSSLRKETDPGKANVKFKQLKDCLFNMADINYNIWNVQTAADLASANGIRLAVSGFNWRNAGSCEKKVEEYGSIGNITAWNLYSDLAADPLVNNLDLFAKTYDAVRSIDPGRLLLWNMVPSTIASEPAVRLTEMQRLLKPGMWCVYSNASYTQACDASGNPLPGSKPKLISSFYSSLETLMTLAKETGRPFWHYANCMSYHYTGSSTMVPVKWEILRHSVNSALAYGAKGIRWWEYELRASTADARYFTAPTDTDGNIIAEPYDMVRTMNRSIRDYQGIYLHSKDHEVYHTGDVIPQGTRRAPSMVGPFTYFKAGTEGVVLSLFSSMERRYAMVVNHSVTFHQNFSFYFNSDKFEVNLLTGNNTVAPTEATKAQQDTGFANGPEDPAVYSTNTYQLVPGGCAIFEYKSKA